MIYLYIALDVPNKHYVYTITVYLDWVYHLKLQSLQPCFNYASTHRNNNILQTVNHFKHSLAYKWVQIQNKLHDTQNTTI